MTRLFAITFDYLCPFARNAAEHVIEGVRAGADWEVQFTPFSLSQVHVEEGGVAVWDRDEPWAKSGVLALAVGLSVRDHFPEQFLDAHEALFAARHDHGRDIKDREVLTDALRAAGLDPDQVLEHVDSGEALETLHKEHEAAVSEHQVWGVPTFVGADRAVFVRLMDRPDGDGERAKRTVEGVLDLVDGWVDLNEFKQTVIPR